MKLNMVLGALVVSVCLCGHSFGAELLNRMMGANNHGCGCCAPTCCAAEPSCGCEKAPACEASCGCAQVSDCAPACEATCGCEKSCGCETSCGTARNGKHCTIRDEAYSS